jgi:recombinational DNA repair protein (RecF pathway)
MIQHSGFRLRLDQCVKCESTLDTAWYLGENRGLVCFKCFQQSSVTYKLNEFELSSLKALEQSTLNDVVKLYNGGIITDKDMDSLMRFLLLYIGKELNVYFKSISVYRDIKKTLDMDKIHDNVM